MPAVVAAFKNLIRKHHHPQQRHLVPDEQQDAARQQPQQNYCNQEPDSGSAKQRADHPTSPLAPGPEFAQTHDMVIPEDHQPKAKMPTYKGLENFKLLDKMGDGAFSNVYKAIDLTTKEKVAVKVVRKFELNASQAGEKHLSPHFKKRPRATEPWDSSCLSESLAYKHSQRYFPTMGVRHYIGADKSVEVQIMRGINHPSIVKLLSFSESPEYYFLVLELMNGGELFHQIVKLTYFSENLSRHVILQVAQGIRYLHEERGVVHRDIKPENLLFERIAIVPSKNPVHRPYDEEKEDEGEYIPGVGGGGIGRIKIADFGLSKVVWNEETMTPCGTVGYTAPEIVKDERYSKSVDMWALGCVLYTLLCGFPPFYDESINVLTEKVARGYYTFLSPWWDDISDSAKDLIQHLLCVDPAQRFTIDEFLAHPWCTAAPAPPPLPTPAVYPREPLDSPLLAAARGLADARSPGLASLKEAFDVTYAVHRMEEEGARRRAYNGRGGAGTRGFLQGLNEEEEVSDADDENVVNEARQKRGEGLDGRATEGAKVFAAPKAARGPVNLDGNVGVVRTRQRDRGHHESPKGFELDLDNATLLGRRHKKNARDVVIGPLAESAITGTNPLPPGSPMRVV
ncbi:kinase-like domain-containing protein [Pisolithus marmoratus]|nr:kinase-like domain-containing protein [Pisolithus marmoratus]